ncbi:hypothetical protein FRC12_009861 [Ceratobasidium sp. 428]|nr:hypothetical protein FRC12_009861 [Ceratobasidium sp. 428]
MSSVDEKAGAVQDSDYQSDSMSAKSPFLYETSSESSDSDDDGDESKDTKPKTQFNEVKVGVWTVYYAIGGAWASQLPGFNPMRRTQAAIKGLPIVWNFLLENFALGPSLFIIYFAATILSGLLASIKLYNSMKILELIENAGKDRTINRQKFERVVTRYLLAFAVDWAVKKINARSEPVLKQRIVLHFKTRLLAAQSRLDYTTFEKSTVRSKFDRAHGYSSSAWPIVEHVSGSISMVVKLISQASVMTRVVQSRQDLWLFFGICMARSLSSEFVWHFGSTPFYTRITDSRWLRMESLFEMGTSSEYKQEMLGDNLAEYINTEHKKKIDELGDTRGDDPELQWSDQGFNLSEFYDIIDLVPMVVSAWGAIHGSGSSSLSSLMLMQQATRSFRSTFSRIWYKGNDLVKVISNIVSLSEALESKSGMSDGEVIYPEEKYINQKGMSIEFKYVSFSYPRSSREILKNVSFRIAPGQLCVIVGENGCGKSTTISSISRLYDCTSGEILIDGRPLQDFKMSSVRDATCIMYQNYSHYPLLIGENILLGRPDSKSPQEDMEEAAKKAGSYNFIQKLPDKFDTDLADNSTGYTMEKFEDGQEDPFESLADSHINRVELSGGEWRRLALAKAYMRYSDRVKLLCYDEPSASLDPKAEFRTFERIRSLQGQKTMIFITHRFGHLTKHANLILYMQDGAIIEQGTHKELMALDGEYAKMYNVQSQAFLPVDV